MKLSIVGRTNVIPSPKRTSDPASETRLKTLAADAPQEDDVDEPKDSEEYTALFRRGLSAADQLEAERFSNEVYALMFPLDGSGHSLTDAWTLAGACDAVHELLKLEPGMSVLEAVALVGHVEDTRERGEEDAPVTYRETRIDASSRPSRRDAQGDPAMPLVLGHESAVGRLEAPIKTSKGVPPTSAGARSVMPRPSADTAGIYPASRPLPARFPGEPMSATGPPLSIAGVLSGIEAIGAEAKRLASWSARLRRDVESWLWSGKVRSL